MLSSNYTNMMLMGVFYMRQYLMNKIMFTHKCDVHLCTAVHPQIKCSYYLHVDLFAVCVLALLAVAAD